MRRINNSQPLAVTTQFRPLSTSMHIEVLGGLSTAQFYKSVSNAWMPDHTVEPSFNADGSQRDGALRLKAVYSVIDADGLLKAENVNPQIFWYVDDTQITSSDVSADFYIAGDILYVRKNYTHIQSATVLCECRFTDMRTQQPFILSDTLSLTAVLQADEQWQLSLLCDKTQKHFPLSAMSTIYSFQADASLGGILHNDDVAWFWDYSLDNGKTWREITAECYWYVSGKNTNTLRVDMDYIESIMVRARIATEKTATAPDLPNAVTASCVWRTPNIVPAVFCYGGERVFADTDFMTFGVIVHMAGHNDLTEAQKRAWLMFDWAKRLQGSTTRPVSLNAHETECVVPGAQLFNMSNEKYIIDPQLSLRSVYDAIADHNGNIIADHNSNLLAMRS